MNFIDYFVKSDNLRTISFLVTRADRGEETNGTRNSRGGETTERYDGGREKMGGQGRIAEGRGGRSQETAILKVSEGADRGERAAANPRARAEARGEPVHQFKQHRAATRRDREAAQEGG